MHTLVDAHAHAHPIAQTLPHTRARARKHADGFRSMQNGKVIRSMQLSTRTCTPPLLRTLTRTRACTRHTKRIRSALRGSMLGSLASHTRTRERL
eukprot:6195057-Pleurochrysis_carterae.AAC.1